YANDWLNGYRKRFYVGTAHLDYLFNITSLMDRSSARRFHIIGALGAGAAFCGNSDAESSLGPAVVAGVQFRYNLPGNIDVHIEPNVTAWANRVIMDFASPHRFTADMRVSFGASYRF
ncbi:MAG: hypothetical protein K2F82_01865, partial [Muribaculaceae bacterium]|nr:hypothetical protein [Muribaculaceae bacterium]